jgi:protein SCO1/2
MRILRPCVSALAAILLFACDPQTTTVHEAIGTVQGVDAEASQVLIDHEAIPDLMPAMTMSFDVADPELLEWLAAGQLIRFRIEHGERSFRILSAAIIGEGEAGRSGVSLDAVLPEADPAPPFRLVDVAGEERTLASLRGKVVLLDFVYTNCPGPCPIQTALQVELQRALPGTLREGVQLVSISLDPERDTPEALGRYAETHGADLANWWFLTGDRESVGEVLAAYGIGVAPGEGIGEISHLVVRFLIDREGNVAQRYFGLEHEAGTILGDVKRLASG